MLPTPVTRRQSLRRIFGLRWKSSNLFLIHHWPCASVYWNKNKKNWKRWAEKG